MLTFIFSEGVVDRACTPAYLFCINLFPYFIVAWQQPYVNLFKSYGTAKWEKCCKKGDVSQVMVI